MVQLVVVLHRDVAPERCIQPAEIVLLWSSARYMFWMSLLHYVPQDLLVNVGVRLKQHDTSIDSCTLTPTPVPPIVFCDLITSEEVAAIDLLAMLVIVGASPQGCRSLELEQLINVIQNSQIQIKHQHLGILPQAQDMQLCEHTSKATSFASKEAFARLDVINSLQDPDLFQALQGFWRHVARKQQHPVMLGLRLLLQGVTQDQRPKHKPRRASPQACNESKALC
mmetsp:Transcript_59090/g.109184  ORF Transcript_59090/g.109184 Transcript_59090/m.109184 type:complete len:225 (-) Transcript_59090:33-707(-)